MFDDFFILSTAISSFNNAALYNPLFLSIGVLMAPLFFWVYLYAPDFISRIGWDKKDMVAKTGFFSSLILMLWLLIFGGNYAVIRDGISLLPLVIAFVLFMITLFVVNQSIFLKYIEKISGKKTRWIVLLILLGLAGLSAMPTWSGILLQISAIICGMIVGCRIKRQINPVPMTSFLMGVVMVAILMQPEYFRFGQLGNLTIVHILSVMLVGLFAVTALVARYTNARSKIYNSAYIKLKWLFRILSLLAFVLFISTESVPVFVGLMFVTAFSEMLTIYHMSGDFKGLSKKAWGLLLVGFGVLVICPVISALGIIYLTTQTDNLRIKDFRDLL